MLLHQEQHAIGAIARSEKLDLLVEGCVIDEAGLEKRRHLVTIAILRNAFASIRPSLAQALDQSKTNFVGCAMRIGNARDERPEAIG